MNAFHRVIFNIVNSAELDTSFVRPPVTVRNLTVGCSKYRHPLPCKSADPDAGVPRMRRPCFGCSFDLNPLLINDLSIPHLSMTLPVCRTPRIES